MIIKEERIGNQRVILGDCQQVMPLLGEFDALVTDPPYGIDGGSGTESIKRAKGAYNPTFNDTPENIQNKIIPIVVCAISKTKRGAVTPGIKHCFDYPKPKDIGAFIQLNGSGLHYWGRILSQPILFYGNDPRLGKTISNASKVIQEKIEKINHPCPKPIQAWRWLVNKVSLDNESILDPFVGSGTTLVACQQMGRHGTGIEIDPDYFKIACERVHNAWAQPDLFIES